MKAIPILMLVVCALDAQQQTPVSTVDTSISPVGFVSPGDAANRAIRVNVVAGGGAGGTSATFGVPFPGTGTAAGFIDFSGNMAGGNLDASGNLKVNCLTGCGGGGGGGGTSSTFGALFPASGTAAGAKDQSGNMSAMLLDGSGRLIVNGSGVTQPVSGTVTALQGGAPWSVSQSGTWNIGTLTSLVNPLPAGTNVIGHVIADSGSTTVVTGTVSVSGTVTANAGSNLNTSALALDTTVGNVQVATGTTAPTKIEVIGGKTSDVTPQYQPIPLTAAGAAVKVDASGATLSISGTVTANQGPTPWGVTQSGTWNIATLTTLTGITNALPSGTNVIGHVIVDTAPVTHVIADSGTLTAVTAITNALPAGTNVIGHVIVDTAPVTHVIADSGTITAVTAITNALPSGTNVIGHFIADSGSTTAVTGSVTISGTVTANAGSNLNTSALALESGGNLATLAGAVSGGVVQTNVTQFNGVAPDMNVGNASAATQRVVLASNQPTVTTSDIANVTQGTTTAPSTVTVVAGRTSDTAPQYRALPLTSNGNSVAVSTYGGPPLPLPKCNPVRRYYCQ